jgi:hypothetical protein
MQIHRKLLPSVLTVDILQLIACQGYLGQLFGLRCMLNSTVSARDSRFILVRVLVIE